MDELDIAIVKLLRADAKLSCSALARKLKIPISSIWDRMKKLNLRYAVLPNWAGCGYTQFYWSIVDKKYVDALMKDKNVNNLIIIYTFNLCFSSELGCK